MAFGSRVQSFSRWQRLQFRLIAWSSSLMWTSVIASVALYVIPAPFILRALIQVLGLLTGLVFLVRARHTKQPQDWFVAILFIIFNGPGVLNLVRYALS